MEDRALATQHPHRTYTTSTRCRQRTHRMEGWKLEGRRQLILGSGWEEFAAGKGRQAMTVWTKPSRPETAASARTWGSQREHSLIFGGKPGERTTDTLSRANRAATSVDHFAVVCPALFLPGSSHYVSLETSPRGSIIFTDSVHSVNSIL